MTSKELKKLRRADLLEMLLTVSKENTQLREQVKTLQDQLEDRNLKLEQSGNLAEAALQLSGIFEAAQAACEQYQENIRQRCEELEQQTARKCEAMLAQAQEQTERYSWLTEMMGETK